MAKTATLPKLELLALLIGSQLTDFFLQELDINVEKIHIFSDSNITLSQLHSGRNGGTFVNNRVRKMRALHESWLSKNIDSRYYCVHTNDNIADCATRGLNSSALQDHEWWKGPGFILTDYQTGPR
ncbi:hypothetical protein ANCCAN_24922 [Ancylostoma caninum]|uniref:RNase H type-1 domain-containing protein n=1 Tax=Ancylostoma caninum TaxID=29170 RepID=A0A368FB34_ANCCA|nr:hypothetical protein ANCCAN_24922 [Ancylostoma caninum]